MLRSWSDRIFGGVCGGLASSTPLPSHLWRLIFILLTLITLGVGALIYVIWWWLLPQESPITRVSRKPLSTLIALIASLALIALLVTHLSAPSDNTLIFMSIVLAVVFFYRQLTASGDEKRIILPALLLIALPIVSFFGANETIPFGINDLILRGLPALLIFAGLFIVLRRRVPLGGAIALVVSVGFVFLIATAAYSSRSSQLRDDNRVQDTITVEDDITTLLIDVETLQTQVEFFAATDERTINYEFVGSSESDLDISYTSAEGGIANFRLFEQQSNPYPLLDAVGGGVLQVELPTDIAIAITFAGDDGDVTFDLDDIDLERLNMDVTRGTALVTLPAYVPLSPSVAENPGQFAVFDGNLRLVVPDDFGAQFILNRNRGVRPIFDNTRYLLIDDGADGTLQTIGFDSADERIRYTVTVPNGEIRVDVGETLDTTP